LSNDPSSEVVATIQPGLGFSDYFILIVYGALLFGFVAFFGPPMSLHEARLPECAREMLASGNWIFPRNGTRPWLERPPLPHWIMIAFSKAMGQRCDTQWSARVPAAAMGLVSVLLTAWVGAKWFGRRLGLVAGLVLATMYEFYRYSTLAEDDIFLAAVVMAAMTLLVQIEFAADPSVKDSQLDFFGWRSWKVFWFFVLLGLTNLAKGPIVGAAVILGPLGVYLLWQKDWKGVRRYCWCWGILIASVLALSWHVAAALKFHDYLANLRYDFSVSKEFDEPWWYYLPQLLGVTMPWSPAALLGLGITTGSAFRRRNAVHRFLWCWAIVPIIVLSIPHRKHHHYLVPSLMPWAILAAIALPRITQQMFTGKEWMRRAKFGLLVYGLPGAVALGVVILLHKLPGPWWGGVLLIVVWLACVWMFYRGLFTKKAAWLLAAIVFGEGVAFCWGQVYLPNDTIDDTQFLRRVDAAVPLDKPMAVDGALGPLDFFRVQFYLRGDAILLHNLSYLRSSEIPSPDIYVVARKYDLAPLQTLGDVTLLDSSVKTRRQKVDGQRLALFHLVFKSDLTRFAPPVVSVMQAMERAPGPDCGPALAEGGSPPD
jgi:4-amino-4-deoxy-L-arabinose transferase-like glycosyltransferase